MNPVTNILSTLKDSGNLGREYTQKEYEHLQLKVFYKLARYTSGTAKKLILGTILLLTLFFSSIALAFYLGEYTGSIPIGFLLVAAIYAVVLVTIYLLRQKIEKYIINGLAQIYFNS